jgi:IS5 family transposase
MKALIGKVAWICGEARQFCGNAKKVGSISGEAMGLIGHLELMLPLMEQVVSCARRATAGETVPASERIFSIFEPHTELLKRGKAHKPVEFGHMIALGQTGEKFISYYRVEEHSQHDIYLGDDALRNHKEMFGGYPSEYAADKNFYGGPEHSAKWRERIQTYSVGKKGRRNENETRREHGFMFRLLQQFRAGSEGSISFLKRMFGLCRCLNRGFNSFASAIGNIVFCHNLILATRL